MAVSGTVSTTTFDTGRVIDHALRRCRLAAQSITPEMQEVAKYNLYLLLSSLPNMGDQLWSRDSLVLSLTQGVANITLPTGTVDLENVLYRQVVQYTGGLTARLGGQLVSFGSGSTPIITTLGVIFATGGTYNLILEVSSDGVTFTNSNTVGSAVYTAGTLYWFDLNIIQAAGYISIRDAAAQTLSFTSIYPAGSPSSSAMYRMSQDDYTNMSSSQIFGRPSQFWLDRQRDAPIMRLDRAPDAASALNQIVAYRKRQIMDVGTLGQSLDIPQRWYEAVVWGLAWRIGMETPEVDKETIPLLKQLSDEALLMVQSAERDKGPIRFAPNISGYTR